MKRSIADDGATRETLNATVAAYLDALEKIQLYAPPFQEDFVARFRRNLKTIADQIRTQLSVPALQQSAAQIGEELKTLFQNCSSVVKRFGEETRSLVRVLSDATRSFETRDENCRQIFHRFSERVERISEISDIHELRRKLRSELTTLRDSVDGLMVESHAAVRGMQQAVQQAQANSEEAHELAYLDALTHLPNRRQADALLAEKLRSASVWSVILLDVNRFKSINDAYGHACGDAVLLFTANLLKDVVGGAGVVCRWAGDEFLIILDCDLIRAFAITKRLQNAWGNHPIQYAGTTTQIQISASAGLCQHLPGESAANLLARVDSEMYLDKNSARTSPGLRR